MNCLTQERTSCLRRASVLDAAENCLDQLQPPSEMNTFSSGWAALSSLSCRKLPDSLASHGTALPSTVRAGER